MIGIFQSTLPRRERRYTWNNARNKDIFQSTLPRRERRAKRLFLLYFLYFNPRSREGSDAVCAMMGNMWVISIHAPAKGATSDLATYGRDAKAFQSTLPRRERLSPTCQRYLSPIISIHAPAKGATCHVKVYISLDA